MSVPGLLSAECVSGTNGSYLSVTVHGDPADPRVDDVAGDVLANGQVQADWGLHLVDVQISLGNLVDLGRRQREAWLARSM